MIRQTDIPSKDVQDWGCKVMTGLSFVDHPFTKEEVLKAIEACIEAGAVENNAIPIAPGQNWRRMFVWDMAKVIEVAAQTVGKPVKAREVVRIFHPFNLRWITVTENTKIELEFEGPTGQHFMAGKVINGVVKQDYNPDPSVKVGKLLSIRLLEVS